MTWEHDLGAWQSIRERVKAKRPLARLVVRPSANQASADGPSE